MDATLDGEGSPLPDTCRAFCWGILHAIGMFDPAELPADTGKDDPVVCRTYFHLGETFMAALLATNLAIPAGFWFAGKTALPLAFIGGIVLFLPVFVFLPRIIRSAMKVDTDAVLEAFGRNEQAKKVFWAVFIAFAGLILAEVVDPATAQAIISLITGTG